jgi:hypothetical protein
LYAVFVDGMLESVQHECADSGIRAGQAPLVLQAYADDQAAASPNPIGLQRILNAMKRYGDTWGCCANTDKTRILLVGPPEATVAARRHDFHWGTSSLTVVDQVRYLGIWLTSSWSWDTHIAAAYRKGLGAFHAWRPVLLSSRFSVAAKLRIIHSVIRPVLEYGMEVWGPPEGSAPRKRKRGDSRPDPPLQLFDNLLLSACRLACGVRGFRGEAGWTRRACVSPAVLLAVCHVLPSERACDLAHLRYSARLQAASQRSDAPGCLLFRDAAHAALPLDHPWTKRVRRASLLLPESLPSGRSLNRCLCCHVRSQATVAWECALAPYPAADNVSARGRRRGSGPPEHLNPLRCSLSMRSPPLPLLHLPAPIVYPFLCVLSGHLPFCHSVPWDSIPLHGLCPRSNCQVCITRPPPGTAGGYTLVERRWRCVQHFLFSCKASPLECPDPTDLWLDLLDLLSGAAVVAAHVRRALHVDSFDPAAVRRFCMPWLLDPFSFLSAVPRPVSVAVCSILACYILLVGASVADAAVPAGERVFAAGLVHSCLRPLSLPPFSRVARRCPSSFRSFGGAEAEAPLG